MLGKDGVKPFVHLKYSYIQKKKKKKKSLVLVYAQSSAVHSSYTGLHLRLDCHSETCFQDLSVFPTSDHFTGKHIQSD